jgi:hypothetical protein
MKKRPLIAVGALYFAALFGVASAADSLDLSTFKQTMRNPKVVVDTAPVSGLRVRWGNGAYDYGYGAWVACATFANDGPKTATAVRIAFYYLDGDGKVLGKDVLERKGTFSPGVTIEGRGGVMQPRFTDGCLKRKNDSRDSVMIAMVVQGATYEDGTTFDRDVTFVTAAPSPKP